MPNIDVVVGGPAGTGKSTVAYLLKGALESAGVRVTLQDDDDDLDLQARRLVSLARKGTTVSISTRRYRANMRGSPVCAAVPLELLQAIARDYDHPWPNEDAAGLGYRTAMLQRLQCFMPPPGPGAG